MPAADHPDFAGALAGAARSMHNPVSLEDTLQRIVVTARDTLPGFDHVGLSTVDRHHRMTTRAVTSDLVSELDALQYGLREGPCVDAMVSSITLQVVPHIRHEQRWPRYVPSATQQGLRSQLAVKLSLDVEGTLGGLNLYSTVSEEIHPEAVPLAQAFAAHAAIALAGATYVSGLNDALVTRTTIGQAMGILMERYNLDEDQAFAFLVRTASHETSSSGTWRVSWSSKRGESWSSKRGETSPESPSRQQRPRDCRVLVWPSSRGEEMLEPVPETKKALAEYLSLHEPDLDEMLHILGERAQRIVPPLVALSLGLIEEGVTFTLASSNLLGSMLDAAQYVSDEGPCLAAVEDEDTVVTDVEDLLDEGRWHLYAQSAAVEGVASSLSMPIFRDGRVIGGVNLYASAPGAFVGKEEALADALGASAEYAVANADLSFSTRWEAAQAPAHLRARKDIDTAVGLLSVRYEEGIPAARERIRSAAARSGLDEAVLARAIVAVHAAQSG